MAFVTKVAQVSRDGAAQLAFSDKKLQKDYPALYEYLTAAIFEDGSARQLSTLLLFVEGEVLKGCLNDRENARSLWVSGPTFEGLLDAFEGLLAEGKGDWRENKFPQSKPTQKRGR